MRFKLEEHIISDLWSFLTTMHSYDADERTQLLNPKGDDRNEENTSKVHRTSASTADPAPKAIEAPYFRTANNTARSADGDDDGASAAGVERDTYWQRWYVLFLFSTITLWQFTVLNIFGTIADTAKVTLNWNDRTLALMLALPIIGFILSSPWYSWLLDTKGLRTSVLVSGVGFVMSLGIRALPVGIDSVVWTCAIGQFLLGPCAVVFMSGCTTVSSAWFPPHQRTFATAISVQFGGLGQAIGFLIGPQFVPNVDDERNVSVTHGENQSFYQDEGISEQDRQYYFTKIMELLYIELAVAAVLVFCAVVYFPSKPPTAPSNTAEIQRMEFIEGAKTLINGQYFILLMASSVGAYSIWSSMMGPILEESLDVKQSTVGWLGASSSISGTIGGVVIAGFVSCWGCSGKRALVLLTTMTVAIFVWIVLLINRWITPNIESVFVALIVQAFIYSATIPIFFELAVEGSYPVSEGITTTILLVSGMTMDLVFLIIQMIPGLGTHWMTWYTIGSTIVSIFLLLCYRERLNRLAVDVGGEADPLNIEGSPEADPTAF